LHTGRASTISSKRVCGCGLLRGCCQSVPKRGGRGGRIWRRSFFSLVGGAGPFTFLTTANFREPRAGTMHDFPCHSSVSFFLRFVILCLARCGMGNLSVQDAAVHRGKALGCEAPVESHLLSRPARHPGCPSVSFMRRALRSIF